MTTTSKAISVFWSLILFSNLALASVYYLDPVNGDLNNDGSINNPLPGIEQVIDANMIESRSYSPLPIDLSVSTLVAKNEGALIQAGDTLYLMDGLHGEIFLRGYYNESAITVMKYADHTPIIQSIRVQAGSNWIFDGLTVSSEPFGTYINHILVFFENHNWHGPVSDIQISNATVYSTEAPWETPEEWLANVSTGIMANGDQMIIKDNYLMNVATGISLGGDFGLVDNNVIENFSKDGMRVLGSDGIYQNNMIMNCYKIDDNHDDGIQSFAINGIIVDRNTIRGNTILNYTDPNQPLLGTLQGIGCFDGFYHDWVIENNVIMVDHWHGLTLLGAANCKLINNTVLDVTPDIEPGASWIRIGPHKDGTPSTGNTIANNVSNRFVIDGGEMFNNGSLLDYDDYDNNFMDYDNYDFRLKPESLLIDAGVQECAPAFDKDGNPRPQGAAPDLGAYEFLTISSTKDLDAIPAGIYPNPNRGDIRLDTALEFDEFQMLTISGAEVLKQNTLGPISSIQVPDQIANGLYIVVLKQDDRIVAQQKLVLAR